MRKLSYVKNIDYRISGYEYVYYVYIEIFEFICKLKKKKRINYSNYKNVY